MTLKKLLRSPKLLITAGLLLADGIVFTAVNPEQTGAVWLILGYILLGVTLFSLANLIATGLRIYGAGPARVGKRLLRYSAGIVTALAGLQSIGQLTPRDIAAMVPLAVVAYLYLSYGRRRNAETT